MKLPVYYIAIYFVIERANILLKQLAGTDNIPWIVNPFSISFVVVEKEQWKALKQEPHVC